MDNTELWEGYTNEKILTEIQLPAWLDGSEQKLDMHEFLQIKPAQIRAAQAYTYS